MSDKLLSSPSKRFYCNVRVSKKETIMGSEVSRAPMFKMFEKYDFRPTQWGTGHPTMVVRAKMAQADLSTRHHQVLL